MSTALTKHPMTEKGAENLRLELNRLKFQERPRIVEAIAEARAHGDLKENAEYHAAREQQSFNEGRILEIESRLSLAQIIDASKLPKDDKVVFGSTVHLTNVDDDRKVIYKIVGEDEADLKEGKISYTSPIARALIGKFVGDAVEVNAPSGLIEYEIDAVEYI